VASAIPDLPAFEVGQVDPLLRAELELVYEGFIELVRTHDLDGILDVLKVSKTDEETLRKEKVSDDFVSFSNWLLAVFPDPSQSTFIALKTVGQNYAGLYSLHAQSGSGSNPSLSLRRFEKIAGQWKLIYSPTEAGGFPMRSEGGPELYDEVIESLASNPLLSLEHPEREVGSYAEGKAAELTEDEVSLKLEFERIYEELYHALEHKDVDAFLSEIMLSWEDEGRIRKQFSRLGGQILMGLPNPEQMDFITLKTKGGSLVGYYCLAPYPYNPSFTFVYLKPFVKHDGQWKMLFSLETDLAMSLNAAKSDGDVTSRALEVIDMVDLLQLRWAAELFRKVIPQKSEESLLLASRDKMAHVMKALAHKDYSVAVGPLEEMANSGLPEAQSLLGRLYAEGNGLERDFLASMELFRSAAAQGDADGLYYLGYSYLHGSGVEVDRMQALAYFILAADRGHVLARAERDRGLSVLNETEREEAIELANAFSFDSR